MENNNNIDILAIGDIAAEPFIKIKDAEENCDPLSGHCKLCLSFGGKIPYESAEVCFAVGNSSNVAIAASRLGLSSYLVSYIGNDNTGKDNLMTLNKEKVHTDYITTVDGLESNYHYVLWYGAERSILTKHTEFPYSLSKDLMEPKWIYLSSLASNSLSYHKEIIEYINNHPDVSLAFQPGTFQIKLGTDAFKEIYSKTKVFLCNHEEAQKILNTEEKDIQKLLTLLYNLGPKIVVITDDVDGAYSYDGVEMLFMKAFLIVPVESTGAGDAFSGAFVTALSQGKEIRDALIWGAANAASVMMHVGPHKGLLSREQIEEYIKKTPEDYKPIKIN